ncbi:hypothetical protein QT381_05395 [Galbitalea sp. SE-J8]|uniref:hypothetical protein n=1 Tax=Galbitalea sp. SE-J8 TaxID=3054952 RepID=UPI00259D1513|nr:hypothetical protein [Galbitalea sp. SE-J8]MDM4762439.1 hypothetical protein [Galbitalea sp. SE-J8]
MGRYTTDAADAAFAPIVARFAGVLDRGTMMGRPILKHAGRMVACLDGDGLGIRLGRESAAFADAMALPGAVLFSPGASGRDFADWVRLPVALEDHWEEFVARAL